MPRPVSVCRRSASTLVVLLCLGPTARLLIGSEPGHVMVDAKRRTTDAEWVPQKTATLEHLRDFSPPAQRISVDKYGGRADRKVEATGFFHARKIDERWWIVDPEGHLWQSAGCCSVRTSSTESGRAALRRKHGTEGPWARQTTALLREHGFNNLGAWSDTELLATVPERLPYTATWGFMSSFGKKLKVAYQKPGHTGYPNDCMPVFHPEFEGFCAEYAQRHLTAAQEDPYLLGHFSDNEMPLRTTALDRYISLPETDPGHQAAKAWIEEHGAVKGKEGYAPDDREAFLGHVLDTYCRAVSEAIRSADPNHMYLGSRLHGSDKRHEIVLRTCGKYVDVVSVNWYGCWTPERASMDDWLEWAGKPFLITEWYAKGMDSGMSNVTGAGWTVKTQEDRGRFYENFTLGLLAHPGCVGWHWFKYMDNDPTNTAADPSNLDSNKGIVSNVYEPYPELLHRMQGINVRKYELIEHFDAKAR